MHGWLDTFIDECMDECMDICMDGCMDSGQKAKLSDRCKQYARKKINKVLSHKNMSLGFQRLTKTLKVKWRYKTY